MPYANNKDADQPAHPRRLRNCKPLTSFCGCTGRFESYLVATPKTGFLVTWLTCIAAHDTGPNVHIGDIILTLGFTISRTSDCNAKNSRGYACLCISLLIGTCMRTHYRGRRGEELYKPCFRSDPFLCSHIRRFALYYSMNIY